MGSQEGVFGREVEVFLPGLGLGSQVCVVCWKV